MSYDRLGTVTSDDDEPLTDLNVQTDASAVAGAEEEEESTTLSVESRIRKAYDAALSLGPILTPSEASSQDDAPTAPPPPRSRKDLEDEPSLDGTVSSPASAPMLPKAERGFSMELPPTVPYAFPPSERVPIDDGPVGPCGPKDTVKIVSNAVGQTIVAPDAPSKAVVLAAPSRPIDSRSPTFVVTPRPRRTHWGRIVVLALLAGALVFGFVKPTVITAFVRTTTASRMPPAPPQVPPPASESAPSPPPVVFAPFVVTPMPTPSARTSSRPPDKQPAPALSSSLHRRGARRAVPLSLPPPEDEALMTQLGSQALASKAARQ